jgi:RecB family exonuclease
MSETRLGLNAAERGEILHQVLMGVFDRIRSHAELQALTAQTQTELLNTQIEAVFQIWAAQRPTVFKKRYRRLEHQRVFKLITAFLELEKNRSPFVVQQVEQEVRVDIGELRFKIRVDRVDVLPEGELIVLDYKTGATTTSGWFGTRPRDLQLPLYSIIQEEMPIVLAMVNLQAGELRYQGLSQYPNVLPGVGTLQMAARYGAAETWEEQQAVWTQKIHSLVRDFSAGIATVTPDEQTCRFCSLAALCRKT